jgi:mRNA interferase RelE/StbE
MAPRQPRREYQIVISRPATKALEGMTEDVQRRIATAIDAFRTDPRPHGCEKLKGRTDQYRVRVGDYRIIYTIEDRVLTVLVLQIGNRRDVYRKRPKR